VISLEKFDEIISAYTAIYTEKIGRSAAELDLFVLWSKPIFALKLRWASK